MKTNLRGKYFIYLIQDCSRPYICTPHTEIFVMGIHLLDVGEKVNKVCNLSTSL